MRSACKTPLELAVLARRFLDGDTKAREALLKRFGSRTKALWRQGRKRFAAFVVDLDTFSAHAMNIATRRLLRNVGASDADCRHRLDLCVRALPAADLFLALGCTSGLPDTARAARTHFAAAYSPLIKDTARSILDSTADIDDLTQELMSLLLVPGFRGPDRPSLVEQYNGLAPMSVWLKTAIIRRCRSRLAARKRQERGISIVTDRQSPSSGGRPPSQAVIAATEKAVRASVAELGHEERLALKLVYRDNLSQKEMARIVFSDDSSRSTISRRLTAARNALRNHLVERIQDEVIEDPGIPETERDLDYVMHQVLPHILRLEEFEYPAKKS